MGTDARLEDLKDQIRTSKIHTSEERNDMADTIHLAEMINGDDDLVRRSLKMMMINGVRRELRDPGRAARIAEAAAKDHVHAAIQTHVVECPAKGHSLVTWKKGEGIKMTGMAAVVFSVFLAFGAVTCGVIYYQHKQTRAMLENLQRPAITAPTTTGARTATVPPFYPLITTQAAPSQP